MWTFSIIMFFLLVIMGVTIGITPLFSRHSTPFGVGIPSESQKLPFVEYRKRRFATINIILSLCLGLPLFFAPFLDDQNQAEMFASIYIPIAIIIIAIVSFGLQLKYRKELLVWKEKQPKQLHQSKITIDTEYHETLDVVTNRTLFWSQFIVIAITIMITILFYDRIPEQIPINWDINFEPNHFTEKGYATALALPMMQVFMMPVLIFTHYSFIQSRQKLSYLDPRISKIKSQLFRRAWSRCSLLIALTTQILLSLVHFYSVFTLPFAPQWLLVVIVIYLVLVLGATLFVSLKYGQSGERLKLGDEDGNEVFYTDAEEDNNWKLGVFYYNKEDPAVFVEKRFGLGTTLNMARWQSWLAVGGLIIFMIVTLVWTLVIS